MSTVQFGIYLAGTDRSTAQLSRVVPKGCIPKDSMLYAAMSFPSNSSNGIVYISLESSMSPIYVFMIIDRLEAEYTLKTGCIPRSIYDYLCIPEPKAPIPRYLLRVRDALRIHVFLHLRKLYMYPNYGYSLIPKLQVYQSPGFSVQIMHKYCDLLNRIAWSHSDYNTCDLKCELVANNYVLSSDWDGYFDEPLAMVGIPYCSISVSFTHRITLMPVTNVYICAKFTNILSKSTRGYIAHSKQLWRMKGNCVYLINNGSMQNITSSLSLQNILHTRQILLNCKNDLQRSGFNHWYNG